MSYQICNGTILSTEFICSHIESVKVHDEKTSTCEICPSNFIEKGCSKTLVESVYEE